VVAGGGLLVLCLAGLLLFGGQIERFFSDFGVVLPGVTRLTMDLSEVLRSNPIEGLAVFAGVIVATIGAYFVARKAAWVGVLFAAASITLTILIVLSVVYPMVMVERAAG